MALISASVKCFESDAKSVFMRENGWQTERSQCWNKCADAFASIFGVRIALIHTFIIFNCKQTLRQQQQQTNFSVLFRQNEIILEPKRT